MIQKGFGTRIYYVSLDGFDTHSEQAADHSRLLDELSRVVADFFWQLGQGDNHAPRVVVMTYSEFGRRVRENGSRGTAHGSGPCLFVTGPRVQGGTVGKHPKLDDLVDGDLRFQADIRRVYATLLDQWL